jgi:hypothetical protein
MTAERLLPIFEVRHDRPLRPDRGPHTPYWVNQAVSYDVRVAPVDFGTGQADQQDVLEQSPTEGDPTDTRQPGQELCCFSNQAGHRQVEPGGDGTERSSVSKVGHEGSEH